MNRPILLEIFVPGKLDVAIRKAWWWAPWSAVNRLGRSVYWLCFDVFWYNKEVL